VPIEIIERALTEQLVLTDVRKPEETLDFGKIPTPVFCQVRRPVLSYGLLFVLYSITCSAVALSRVLRTALVPYGNIETSAPRSFETSQVITTKLCTFNYVCETYTCAKFGWNPLARSRSTHT